MRRLITMLTVAAMLAAMLVLASPVSAQGGCKEFGNAVGGFTQEFKPFGQVLSGLAPLNENISSDKEIFCPTG